MSDASKATIEVRAGNDSSPSRKFTSVDVFGENFLLGSAVNIVANGRRGTAFVEPDGAFKWSTEFRPPLACNTTVSVWVHGADGISVEGFTDVFCP